MSRGAKRPLAISCRAILLVLLAVPELNLAGDSALGWRLTESIGRLTTRYPKWKSSALDKTENIGSTYVCSHGRDERKRISRDRCTLLTPGTKGESMGLSTTRTLGGGGPAGRDSFNCRRPRPCHNRDIAERKVSRRRWPVPCRVLTTTSTDPRYVGRRVTQVRFNDIENSHAYGNVFRSYPHTVLPFTSSMTLQA